MADWFWMKDGQEHGPVDTGKLKQLAQTGQLQQTDLIWREGLGAWVPASRAKGLFPEQSLSQSEESPVQDSPPQTESKNVYENSLRGGSGVSPVCPTVLPKKRGPSIKEKLTRAVGSIKKRGLALKLGHEANNLQTAVEAQLEVLGAMTLTHRPATVDIGPRVTELSQIQVELSQKQTTLETLRQTKGSGSVVKELSHEVARLQSRQKGVVVGIGRMALGARPEMPGTAGPYSALDRLESSLEAKQKELKTIEDCIGPVWQTGGISFRAMKRPIVVVGAVTGSLITLYLLWIVLAATLFAGALPSWARYYVPDGTQVVIYANVDQARQTKFFKKVEGLVSSVQDLPDSPGIVLHPEYVREVLYVSEKGKNLLVLRTHDDLPLSKMLSKRDKVEKYKGFECMRTDLVCFAKTGNCTYCMVSSENELEQLLRRLDKKESPELNKNLLRAIQDVGRNDYYLAGHLSDLTGSIEDASAALDTLSGRLKSDSGGWGLSGHSAMSPRAKKAMGHLFDLLRQALDVFGKADYYWLCVSGDSSVTIRGSVVFADKKDARELAAVLGELTGNGLDAELKAAKSFFRNAMKDTMSESELSQYFKMIDAPDSHKITVSERGKEVSIQVDASEEYLEAAFFVPVRKGITAGRQKASAGVGGGG